LKENKENKSIHPMWTEKARTLQQKHQPNMDGKSISVNAKSMNLATKSSSQRRRKKINMATKATEKS